MILDRIAKIIYWIGITAAGLFCLAVIGFVVFFSIVAFLNHVIFQALFVALAIVGVFIWAHNRLERKGYFNADR